MSVKRDKQRYYKMKRFAVVCIYILNMYICDDYQQKPFLLIVNHFITFKEGISLHSECLITLNVVSENFHIYTICTSTGIWCAIVTLRPETKKWFISIKTTKIWNWHCETSRLILFVMLWILLLYAKFAKIIQYEWKTDSAWMVKNIKPLYHERLLTYSQRKTLI